MFCLIEFIYPLLSPKSMFGWAMRVLGVASVIPQNGGINNTTTTMVLLNTHVLVTSSH